MGLIDTGSTVSVVHPSVLARLSEDCEIPLSRETGRLRLADGSVTGSLGTVQLDLQLGTGKDVWSHVMVVAEIEAPVVIGIDFLRKYQCTLSMKDESLTVGGTVHSCRSIDVMPQVFRVSVAETVEVPPMSEMIIPGETCAGSHLTQGIIEGHDRPLCDGNVVVARVVLNPAEETLPLRVINLSGEPQTLYKGTDVATCQPVSHVSEQDLELDSSSSRSNVTSELPDHLQSLANEYEDRLKADERDMAGCLLSEFTDSFAKSKNDLSITSVDKHSMTMASQQRVKMGPGRLPLAKRKALKCELDQLLSLGVIEPSSSSWASPVVLVTKKDGSLRLCVDYRKVNDLLIKDSYPLPRIDDSLDALSGAKWFSTLDLASGYWQVPMDPKDIDKTALTTPYGLFHFKVMPFGLANAPATFERMMEQVLAGLHWEVCLIYLDDVIVFSRTFEEHIVRLHQVFSRIKGANLKLSPTKCRLFCHEVGYLGHIVSKDGVATDPKKIEAISSWPVPRTTKEVRSFVGLCSYYRRFVRGFADIARPLHRATEANREFYWSSECQEAFDKLKKALTTPPILAYPSEAGLFWLDTDASGSGVGAVLSQEQDGEKRVIAYYSRVLSGNERNYCVTRRELLAVVLAVKHFHHYLWGRHFMVRSDHGSLRWLMNFKNPVGQLWRWLQVLSEYDFEIQYRPGAQHRNADGLSRRPCHECRHCEWQESKDSVDDRLSRPSDLCDQFWRRHLRWEMGSTMVRWSVASVAKRGSYRSQGSRLGAEWRETTMEGRADGRYHHSDILVQLWATGAHQSHSVLQDRQRWTNLSSTGGPTGYTWTDIRFSARKTHRRAPWDLTDKCKRTQTVLVARNEERCDAVVQTVQQMSAPESSSWTSTITTSSRACRTTNGTYRIWYSKFSGYDYRGKHLCTCHMRLLYQVGRGLCSSRSQGVHSRWCLSDRSFSSVRSALLHPFGSGTRVYVGTHDGTVSVTWGAAHTDLSLSSTIWWVSRTFQPYVDQQAVKILLWKKRWLGPTSTFFTVCISSNSKWKYWLFSQFTHVRSWNNNANRPHVPIPSV